MASPSYNQSHFINLRDERGFRKAFNLTRPLLLRRVFYVEHMLKFLQTQEPQTFTLLKRVLSEACGREDATFVDSGANDGAWSLVAASYGCKVIAVEPQPMCTRFLQEGVDANTWLDGRIKVFNAFLSPKPMSATLKDDVCHGIRTVLPNGNIGVSNSHAKGDFKGRGKDVVVKSSTLGELLPAHDRVAFWHVDVEGAELSVLDSAASLFAERRVDPVEVRWRSRRACSRGRRSTTSPSDQEVDIDVRGAPDYCRGVSPRWQSVLRARVRGDACGSYYWG